MGIMMSRSSLYMGMGRVLIEEMGKMLRRVMWSV